MFEYTKAAFKKIIDDFRKIDLARSILTQLLYIAYLIYVICIRSGVLPLNIALLSLATAYFLFFLYVKARSVKKELKKLVKKIYKWCKRLIKLVNLSIVIYGLSITASHFTAPSVILAALMIVGWVLEILFEVVLQFFIGKAKFILEGMEADYKNATKPVKSVKNFFKKLTGKKVEEEPAPSKNREILDKMVAKERREKENERAEKRGKAFLWLQDKVPFFAPKNKQANPDEKTGLENDFSGDFNDEQIPALTEEEFFFNFDEEL